MEAADRFVDARSGWTSGKSQQTKGSFNPSSDRFSETKSGWNSKSNKSGNSPFFLFSSVEWRQSYRTEEKPKAGPYRSSRVLYNCASYGHFAKNCPNRLRPEKLGAGLADDDSSLNSNRPRRKKEKSRNKDVPVPTAT